MGALHSLNDLTVRLFPALFPTLTLERELFFFFFFNSPVKIWMIISTFGFHLLKCNVSSNPQAAPPRPPLQTPEWDLALASNLHSLNYRLARPRILSTGSARQGRKRGLIVGTGVCRATSSPLPLSSNAPSAAHVSHDLTTTTEHFSSHHPDPSSSLAAHSIIVLK